MIKDPKQQNDIKALVGVCSVVKAVEIRIRPYPPSFRRMAARIIDPDTGAST